MKSADPSHGDHRAGADTPSCSWMGVRVFGCDAHTMVQIPAHVIPDAPNPAEQIGPRPQKEKKPRHGGRPQQCWNRGQGHILKTKDRPSSQTARAMQPIDFAGRKLDMWQPLTSMLVAVIAISSDRRHNLQCNTDE